MSRLWERVRGPAYLVVPVVVVYGSLFFGMIPLMCVIVLFSAAFVVLFFVDGGRFMFWASKEARRERRRLRGECLECGYDLRGHRGEGMSGRCPECGAAIEKGEAGG